MTKKKRHKGTSKAVEKFSPFLSATGWCFGLINNRLAEIFYEQGKIQGYCYVHEREYKTKQEHRWIREDTERVQLTLRKGVYRDKLTGNIIPKGAFPDIKHEKVIGPFENAKEAIKALKKTKV